MPNPSIESEQEGVHLIRPGEVSDVDGNTVVTAYAWGGNEVEAVSPEALAKKSFDQATRTTRYWLKRATTGPDAGRLFNPLSPTFNAQAAARFHEELGRGRYEFKKATAAAFDLYVRFITTKNPLYIRNAERC